MDIENPPQPSILSMPPLHERVAEDLFPRMTDRLKDLGQIYSMNIQLVNSKNIEEKLEDIRVLKHTSQSILSKFLLTPGLRTLGQWLYESCDDMLTNRELVQGLISVLSEETLTNEHFEIAHHLGLGLEKLQKVAQDSKDLDSLCELFFIFYKFYNANMTAILSWLESYRERVKDPNFKRQILISEQVARFQPPQALLPPNDIFHSFSNSSFTMPFSSPKFKQQQLYMQHQQQLQQQQKLSQQYFQEQQQLLQQQQLQSQQQLQQQQQHQQPQQQHYKQQQYSNHSQGPPQTINPLLKAGKYPPILPLMKQQHQQQQQYQQQHHHHHQYQQSSSSQTSQQQQQHKQQHQNQAQEKELPLREPKQQPPPPPPPLINKNDSQQQKEKADSKSRSNQQSTKQAIQLKSLQQLTQLQSQCVPTAKFQPSNSQGSHQLKQQQFDQNKAKQNEHLEKMKQFPSPQPVNMVVPTGAQAAAVAALVGIQIQNPLAQKLTKSFPGLASGVPTEGKMIMKMSSGIGRTRQRGGSPQVIKKPKLNSQSSNNQLPNGTAVAAKSSPSKTNAPTSIKITSTTTNQTSNTTSSRDKIPKTIIQFSTEVKVKRFRKEDEPNARDMTDSEVAVYAAECAKRREKNKQVYYNAQDMRSREMKLEKDNRNQLREQERKEREKLDAMVVDIPWSKPYRMSLASVEFREHLSRNSTEKAAHANRIRGKRRAYYFTPSDIPSTPSYNLLNARYIEGEPRQIQLNKLDKADFIQIIEMTITSSQKQTKNSFDKPVPKGILKRSKEEKDRLRKKFLEDKRRQVEEEERLKKNINPQVLKQLIGWVQNQNQNSKEEMMETIKKLGLSEKELYNIYQNINLIKRVQKQQFYQQQQFHVISSPNLKNQSPQHQIKNDNNYHSWNIPAHNNNQQQQYKMQYQPNNSNNNNNVPIQNMRKDKLVGGNNNTSSTQNNYNNNNTSKSTTSIAINPEDLPLRMNKTNAISSGSSQNIINNTFNENNNANSSKSAVNNVFLSNQQSSQNSNTNRSIQQQNNQGTRLSFQQMPNGLLAPMPIPPPPPPRQPVEAAAAAAAAAAQPNVSANESVQPSQSVDQTPVSLESNPEPNLIAIAQVQNSTPAEEEQTHNSINNIPQNQQAAQQQIMENINTQTTPQSSSINTNIGNGSSVSTGSTATTAKLTGSNSKSQNAPIVNLSPFGQKSTSRGYQGSESRISSASQSIPQDQQIEAPSSANKQGSVQKNNDSQIPSIITIHSNENSNSNSKGKYNRQPNEYDREYPCRMFHSEAGCKRHVCHFLHIVEFAGRSPPAHLWQSQSHQSNPNNTLNLDSKVFEAKRPNNYNYNRQIIRRSNSNSANKVTDHNQIQKSLITLPLPECTNLTGSGSLNTNNINGVSAITPIPVTASPLRSHQNSDDQFFVPSLSNTSRMTAYQQSILSHPQEPLDMLDSQYQDNEHTMEQELTLNTNQEYEIIDEDNVEQP